MMESKSKSSSRFTVFFRKMCSRNPNVSIRTTQRILLGLIAIGWIVTLIGFETPKSELLGAEKSRTDLEKEFRNSIQPFIETYCFSCHNEEKPKGEVNLQAFSTVEKITKDFPQWETVLDLLKSEQMPPESAKKKPSKESRNEVITWIESLRKDEAKRNAGDPGIVLARRLNNTEYDFTIRDLTGVDIHPAREFPVDPANSAGFDNSGESLQMSPALVNKYMEASRNIANHLILKPSGFEFAPYPVIVDTDRDKYYVNRIVQFYKSQPTDLANYFFAAWSYQHREKLGYAQATLSDIASSNKVSAKYLSMIWEVLSGPSEKSGPIAAIQHLWSSLPTPNNNLKEVRSRCEKIRDCVVQLREKVKVQVGNLRVKQMNRGAQALVLWKNRQMATNRRTYGGGAKGIKLGELTRGVDVGGLLTFPTDNKERESFETSFKRFCSIFPDAFYISERARVFLDNTKEDLLNTGRLLSAGFHNQMGYFRDDQPLYEMMLSEEQKRYLDNLWDEFDFVSNVPNRMHSGLIWFERSESDYLNDTDFDFARAEDKDVVSEAKFKKFADVYLQKARRMTKDETTLKAIEDHFQISEANIRRVEKQHKLSEPTHVKALQDFAERAYRRKLSAKELDDIADFYHTLRKTEELGHEEAVRTTLVSILMSPYFLFRVDLPLSLGKENPGTKQPLSDFALASRLSYFLWSSTPDKELLDHAAKGTLHQREVLLTQTRRMLKDDRVRGFVTQFSGNWLDFRRFEEHSAVDRGRFPTFDNNLRQSMYEEPIRFMEDLVRRDQSLLELLYAKHTFVNEPLARHYGIPYPSKSREWIRVDDATKYGRGGLLPMAVFLTKNAPGLRTSPVKRGYWVVHRVLGERIPPPPPNVPELPKDEKKLNKSLRETLAQHRSDKSCAACHERFDSFGLAFEGFGPIGERRTVDLAGNPVDTQVSFPGGLEGNGLPGLQKYLNDRRQEDFLDNLCRKLLAFGLGRQIQLSDDSTIREMRTQLTRKANRVSSLIETIVTSPQFLNKRSSINSKKE